MGVILIQLASELPYVYYKENLTSIEDKFLKHVQDKGGNLPHVIQHCLTCDSMDDRGWIIDNIDEYLDRLPTDHGFNAANLVDIFITGKWDKIDWEDALKMLNAGCSHNIFIFDHGFV